LELHFRVPNSVKVTTRLENAAVDLSIPQAFRADITNGVVRAEGDRQDLCTLEIANGGVSADWRLLGGDHTLKLSQGSAALTLRPGTSCRYRATVRLGTITVGKRAAMLGGTVEGTIGGGAGNLDLEVGLGSAAVHLP
jgi:hypothetical protein